MPFDLATARPPRQGFDPTTARPVGQRGGFDLSSARPAQEQVPAQAPPAMPMPAPTPFTPDTAVTPSERVSASSPAYGDLVKGMLHSSPMTAPVALTLDVFDHIYKPAPPGEVAAPQAPALPERTWGQELSSLPMRASARIRGVIPELVSADIQSDLEQAKKDREGYEWMMRLIGREPEARDPESQQLLDELAGVRDRQLATAKAAAGEISDFESQTTPSFAQKTVGGAFDSVLASAPALAVGLATRNPWLAAAAAYPTTTAQKFAELTNEGMDPSRALMHGRIQGVIETGTEYLPAVKLFKHGTAGWQRLIDFMGSELPGESVATLGQGLDDYLSHLPGDVTAGDFLKGLAKASEDLPQTWATTLLAGGAQHGIVQAPQTLGDVVGRSLAERRVKPQDLSPQQMDEALGHRQSAYGQTLIPQQDAVVPAAPAATIPAPAALTAGSPTDSAAAVAPPSVTAPALQTATAPPLGSQPAVAPPLPPAPVATRAEAESPELPELPTSQTREAPPTPPAPSVPAPTPVPAAQPVSTGEGTQVGGATPGKATAPTVKHAGPAAEQLTPLASQSQSPTMYHETSVDNLAALAQADNGTSYPGDAHTPSLYVTDDPALALGQGGKGVTITYRTDGLSGTHQAKPGTGIIGGKEFTVSGAARESIEKIQIKDGKAWGAIKTDNPLNKRSIMKSQLLNRFDEQANADGSVTLTRKAPAAPASQPTVSKGETDQQRTVTPTQAAAPVSQTPVSKPDTSKPWVQSVRESMSPDAQQSFMEMASRDTDDFPPQVPKESLPGKPGSKERENAIEETRKQIANDIRAYRRIREQGLEGIDDNDLDTTHRDPDSEDPRDTAQNALATTLTDLAERIMRNRGVIMRAVSQAKGAPKQLVQAVKQASEEKEAPVPEDPDAPVEFGDELPEIQDEEGEMTGLSEDTNDKQEEGPDLLRRQKQKKSKPRTQLPYTQREGEVFAATDDIWTANGLDPDTMELLPPQKRWDKAAEIIKNHFGFKGITRDKNLPHGEAINQLKDAYVGLTNMCAVQGISPLVIGMDRRITLRQHQKVKDAPGALAYFNPATFDLGMTRRNDSFAHEWGHALDWSMVYDYSPELLQIGGRGLTGKLRLGAETKTLDQQVRQQFANVLNAMYFDKAQAAAYVQNLQAQIAKTGSAKQKAKLQTQLDNFIKGASRARGIDSEYYQHAKDIDGGSFEPGSSKDYWQRPTEMFARAYEAYIANKIGGLPANHPFVTQSDSMYADNRVQQFVKAYPEETDRQAIFDAMDDLMRALRDRVLDTKDAPARINPLSQRYWKKQNPSMRPGTIKGAKGIMDRLMPGLQKRREEEQKDDEGPRRRVAQHTSVRNARVTALPHGPTRKLITDIGYRTANTTNSLTSGMGHTVRGFVLGLQERHQNNAGVQELVRMFITDPGSGAKHGVKGQIWDEAIRQQDKIWSNRMKEVVDKHDIQSFDEDSLRDLRDRLVGQKRDDEVSPEVKAAAADLRRFLNDMYEYAKSNKVEMGYAKEDYLPRKPDIQKVEGDPEGFQDKATDMYSEVYDTEIGTTAEILNDPKKRLSNLFTHVNEIAKSGAVPNAKAAAIAAKPLARQVRAKAVEILAAHKAGEDTKGLQQDFEDLVDQLRQDMREPWAREAANDWYQRIVGLGRVAAFDFTARGPDSRFTQSRRLPGVADAIMGDYLITDPLDLISTYVQQSVRRVQYGNFFGNPTQTKGLGWKLHEAMTAAKHPYRAADGSMVRIPEDDMNELQLSVDLLTGRYTTTMTPRGLRFRSRLQATFTPVILARSLYSQLAEPMTTTGITQDSFSGWRIFSRQLGDLLAPVANKLGVNTLAKRKAWRQEMGEYFGIVTDHLTDELTNARYNLLHQSVGDAKKLSRFFQVIGVHPHAMSMKRATANLFMTRYMPLWAQRALDGSKFAADSLKELGITPTKACLDELVKIGEIRSTEELDQLEHIEEIRTAIWRFVQQAHPDPSVADKPRMASQPEYAYMYGVMSFNFAFQRNFTIANGKRITRAFNDKDYKMTAAIGLSVATGTTQLVLLQAASWVLRMMLWSPDDKDEIEKKISEEWLWQGIARAGMYGFADPLVNAFTGLKHGHDLTNLMTGAIPSNVLGNAQDIANAATDRNSKGTATGEYKLSAALWNTVVTPFVTGLALKFAGLNPVTDAIIGMGIIPYISSQKATQQFSEWAAEKWTGQNYETPQEKDAAAREEAAVAKTERRVGGAEGRQERKEARQNQ